MKKLYRYADPNLDNELLEIIAEYNRHLDALKDVHAQYLLLAGREGQRVTTPLILGTETDHTLVEADGSVKSVGAATTWNDINKSLLPLSTGANVPPIIAVNGAAYLKVRAFSGAAITHELGEGFEVLHDYKEGSDVQPHVHWAPTTAAAGTVKLQLAYMWVNRDGIFENETIISVTVNSPGVAWKEQRTNLPLISGAGKEIGSRFQFVLFRIPTEDTYGDQIAPFDFGLHYEQDRRGSRQITTK